MELDLNFLLEEDLDPVEVLDLVLDPDQDLDFDSWLERERECSATCRGLFI